MNTHYLDERLDKLCQQGCRKISSILQQLEQNQCPDELKSYSSAECEYLYTELAAVMAVYDNHCCGL